jgi:hypothetical protein
VERYATTSIVSDTPNPSTFGTAYLVTVDVDATQDPDGAVTVSDGVSQCIATVTAGGGSCSRVATGEGERTLTATFAETATHAASVGTGTHTVVVTDRIFRGRFE